MRALLVGFGSIARRHAENLRSLVPDASLAVLRHREPESRAAPAPLNTCFLYSLEAALDFHPDIALVTGPASRHVQTALALAARGVHLFIEKPLSDTLDGVDELIALCRREALTLLVGYNFRYSAALRVAHASIRRGIIGRLLSLRAEVGQYLPDWRPQSDYRRSVTARAELGGGAVLELSHEIDYARWLAGEVCAVSAITGRVGTLEIDVEDVAEINLRFEDGAIGNLHLDLLQRAPTRTCRIIGSEGTLLWDGMTDALRWYSAASRTWTELVSSPPDRNEMYLDELRHFLACAGGHADPLATGEDARRALCVALAARRSSEEGRTVTP